ETKMAESEMKESDARLADARERLADVQARANKETAAMNKRKGAITDKLNSHDRQAEEASLRMDQDSAEQKLGRAVDSVDDPHMNVRLTSGAKTAAPSHMKVTRNCPVFARPNGKSKVLGTKRAGSTIIGGQPLKDWVGFPIRNGRTAWMAK